MAIRQHHLISGDSDDAAAELNGLLFRFHDYRVCTKRVY
jgi:hypothetical protein